MAEVPWIVVPLFGPDSDVPENLRQLARQAPVVAVDDGSPNSYAHELAKIGALPDVTLIRRDTNRGIAAALNQGVELALERGATLILCFDQDSRPVERYLELAQQLLEEAEKSTPVGALGPWDANTPKGSEPPAGRALIERHSLIQSGMAIPASVFHSVGRFDESLFIDGVDTDFCLRLRRAGYWVGASPRLSMHHTLGVGASHYRQIRIGPLRSTATFHSHDRRYYINRNLVRLLRRYGREEPRWAVAAVRTVVSNDLAAVVFEPGRWNKLRAIFSGLTDGMRGQSGPR